MGLWDQIQEGMEGLSDEAKAIVGDAFECIDDRSVVIDNIVGYEGFLMFMTFMEISGAVMNNSGVYTGSGQCMLIGDFYNIDDPSDNGYVAEIGTDLSISGTGNMPEELKEADIYNFEEWLSNTGEEVDSSVYDLVDGYHGEEPDEEDFGPWSMEKVYAQYKKAFGAASKDELVGTMAHLIQEMLEGCEHLGTASANQLIFLMTSKAGCMGCGNGRPLNEDENEVVQSICNIFNVPELREAMRNSAEEDIDESEYEALSGIIELVPQIAEIFLQMVFCFMCADGPIDSEEELVLERLSGILSVPMGALYMRSMFGLD